MTQTIRDSRTAGAGLTLGKRNSGWDGCADVAVDLPPQETSREAGFAASGAMIAGTV
jgi:hypothetical protein